MTSRVSRRESVHFFGSLLIVVVLAVQIILPPLQADAAVWSNRGWACAYDGGKAYASRSYFDNKCYWGVANPSRVLKDGIPKAVYNPTAGTPYKCESGKGVKGTYFGQQTASDASIADRLLLFLKCMYYSSETKYTSWKASGSAFIVRSMLGTSPGKDKTVTRGLDSPTKAGGHWDTLKEKLYGQTIEYRAYKRDDSSKRGLSSDGVNTQITWNGSSNYDVQRTRYDADKKRASGLLFRSPDKSGTLVTRYKLFIACANPVGEFPDGIPDPTKSADLTPTITGSPQTSEGDGADIDLELSATNQGDASLSGVQWRLTEFRVVPNGTYPGAGVGAQEPRLYYGNNFISEEPGTGTFTAGLTAIGSRVRAVGDFPVGTRFCYGLSVSPYGTASQSGWRYSDPFCVVVAKKPKVQVWGGDLVVGGVVSGVGDVRTSTSRKRVDGQLRTFGSWAEYALIASGEVHGMASGAGYQGGALTPEFCPVSLLSFANSSAGTCTQSTLIGAYRHAGVSLSIAGRYTGGDMASGGVLDLAASTGMYTAQGTLRLRASDTIGAGRTVVVNAPDADVVIEDDIRYTTDELGSIREIPQVVIIARSISIEDDVTNVDAWLSASGFINTCASVAPGGALSASLCNMPLMINGPVAAHELYLYRTAGSGVGTASGDPAEIFNLRADAYLWAMTQSRVSGKVQSVYVRELPTRF